MPEFSLRDFEFCHTEGHHTPGKIVSHTGPSLRSLIPMNLLGAVADSGGVRGVQMHPPLAASNVFLRT